MLRGLDPAAPLRSAALRAGAGRVVLACALALVAGAGAGCGPKLELAPVVLAEEREIDAEVLELVRGKVEAVRRAPGDARAHGALGLVYSANSLWETAERSLANAARIEPGNALWRYHRALALRESGDNANALALLVDVARELPGEAGVQQRLGQWLLEGGDLAGARAAFERALRLAPDQPDVLVGLAGVLLAEERWQAALDLAQRALRKDPGLKAGHYQAGLALRGLGRQAEAERELAQGVGGKTRWIDDPLSAEHRSYRANYVAQLGDATQLMLAGQYAAALPVLERVLKKRPDDVDVIGNVAACLQETGNPARAVELLGHALQVDPNAFATHLNLADAHARLGQLDEALRHAQRACELAPELGRAHLMHARVRSLRKEPEAAYLALRESVRLDPNNPTTYVALFEECAKLERLDEARAWCQRAVELDPTYLPSRVNLAYLTLVSGDLEAARKQIDELVRLAPDNERVKALKRELEARGR